MRLFRIRLHDRPVVHRQFGRQTLGLTGVVVDNHHPAAGPAQAFGHAGDNAHAPARRLALAKFVDYRLQARQAAHPRKQHHVVDGLGQKLVGAGFQALDAVVAAVQSRHHHHRDVTGDVVFLQALADREAIHARHHYVEQNDVRFFLRGHRER